MDTRKFIALCFVAAIGLCAAAFMTIENGKQQTERQKHRREQYNFMLLTFMRGGLPAVEARCILETKQPEEVAPCAKASTPIKGREL